MCRCNVHRETFNFNASVLALKSLCRANTSQSPRCNLDFTRALLIWWYSALSKADLIVRHIRRLTGDEIGNLPVCFKRLVPIAGSRNAGPAEFSCLATAAPDTSSDERYGRKRKFFQKKSRRFLITALNNFKCLSERWLAYDRWIKENSPSLTVRPKWSTSFFASPLFKPHTGQL